MYLFNNHEDGMSKQINRLQTPAIPILRDKRTLFEFLIGEENPLSIGSLLLILVLLLHFWGALWLLQAVEPVTLAQPLMMEVSMLSTPGQQTTTAPPAPPKPVAPIRPKKPPVKKPVKKKTPVKQKQPELPKPVAVAEEMLPAPSREESFEDTKETNRAYRTSC